MGTSAATDASDMTAASRYVFVGFLAVGIVGGLIISLGFIPLSVAVFALVAGAALLMLRSTTMLLLLAISTFVIHGMIGYFLRITQAQWIPYALCLVIGFHVLINHLSNRKTDISTPLPLVFKTALGSLAIFLIILFYSTAVHQPNPISALAAVKNYVPLWMATLLLLSTSAQNIDLKKVWVIGLGILFLQLPIVLWQFLVVAPTRMDVNANSNADAIVGSFGGNIEAGGNNATLTIFCLLILAFYLSLWRAKRVGGLLTLGVVAVCLTVFMVGEVKGLFVWLPLLLAVVFGADIIKQPLRFIAYASTFLCIMAALFFAQQQIYWEKTKKTSVLDNISDMAYFFDPNEQNYKTGEIGRGAALALWIQARDLSVTERLIGTGAGASRISQTGGIGKIALQYLPLSIAASTAAIQLWETGLLGLLSYMTFLAASLLVAFRLSRSQRLNEIERASASSFTVLFLIALSLIFYNSGQMDEPSTQLMIAGALGFLGVLCRRAWPATEKSSTGSSPVLQPAQ